MAGAGLRHAQRRLGAAAEPPHREASSKRHGNKPRTPQNRLETYEKAWKRSQNPFKGLGRWPRRDDLARLLGFGEQGDVKSGGFLNAAAFYMARSPAM